MVLFNLFDIGSPLRKLFLSNYPQNHGVFVPVKCCFVPRSSTNFPINPSRLNESKIKPCTWACLKN